MLALHIRPIAVLFVFSNLSLIVLVYPVFSNKKYSHGFFCSESYNQQHLFGSAFVWNIVSNN
jgi:hypothetical protein